MYLSAGASAFLRAFFELLKASLKNIHLPTWLYLGQHRAHLRSGFYQLLHQLQYPEFFSNSLIHQGLWLLRRAYHFLLDCNLRFHYCLCSHPFLYRCLPLLQRSCCSWSLAKGHLGHFVDHLARVEFLKHQTRVDSSKTRNYLLFLLFFIHQTSE